MRNISLNAHYIVLFKSPRDKQQISMLARQVNHGKVQEFMRSYEDATRRPHGYLMLDLKPTTVPATPKPNFLTPPPTEEERPKLKRNFLHNWVDSTDWRPQDLEMMTPEQREGYEQRLLRERPKYIPMKDEGSIYFSKYMQIYIN